MSDKLVLIDGHSILHRAYYGVPPLTNSEGLHTNAIYGFLNILFKILDEEQPQYLAVAFDVHAKTFRHKMFEAYKGITCVEKEGYEADDILGTLAKRGQAEGMEVSLVSGDRDLLQISDTHIKIRIPKTKSGKTEIEDYYPEDVKEAFQVTPLQFIEWKALVGDTADNIPGVPKIGDKTASALLVQYGTIDEIYAHIDELKGKAVKESLLQNRELADLSKTLATIKIDCEIDVTYQNSKVEQFYTAEAYEWFKRLGFKQYLAKFQTPQMEQGKDITDCFKRRMYQGFKISGRQGKDRVIC